MEFYGFIFFLIGTILYAVFLLLVSFFFRRFRRYLLLTFAVPPTALGLLGFITTILLDNACGPDAAYGPDGEQSFKYCASTWPDHAVYPLWGLSAAVVWTLIYLAQRRLNKKHPFFGGRDMEEKPSDLTTLKL